jgi:uncharacterized protein YgiB involved in biofilm formation
MIKRSFIGILAVVGMLASACSPQPQQVYQQPVAVSQVQQVQAPQPKLYNSVQDCQSDQTNVNPQLCATAFAQSQAQLTHYNSYASCSAYGYNDCVDHGGWFGPMMTGFMLGAMTNGYYGSPVYVLHGGYYGGGYYGHALNYGAPIRVGGHYVLSHDVVVHQHVYVSQHAAPAAVVTRAGFGGSQVASVSAPRPSVAAPSAAATVQRGGFGGGFGGATTVNSGYHASPAYASSYRSSSSGSSYHSSFSSSGSSRRR